MHGPVSLKELSRLLSLPVPVTAAVRRELEKRQILKRERGLALSETGLTLCKDLLALADLISLCPQCSGRGRVISEKLRRTLLPLLESLCQLRPSVDVTLDQALATPLTNLRRAFHILSVLSLKDKHLVFLGDDDWTSASLKLVARFLFKEQCPQFEVIVYDIDQRIIGGLNDWARQQNESLKAVKVDLQSPGNLPNKGKSHLVFTDPPYTNEGLDLFISIAGELLTEKGGKLLLCFPLRAPRHQYQIEWIFHQHHFALLEMLPSWNEYEGNSMHAGQSTLWHLEKVHPDSADKQGDKKNTIYTYSLKKSKNISSFSS